MEILRKYWSNLSYKIQKIRDNPITAREEYNNKISSHKNLKPLENKVNFLIGSVKIKKAKLNRKPKVAILREQGVNGHKEMAHAFMMSGFEAHDVHINDILKDNVDMKFSGFARWLFIW